MVHRVLLKYSRLQPPAAWKFFLRPYLICLWLVLLPFQTHAQVVLNEMVPNPDPEPDADNEWVEIYNAGGTAVDLTGWAIEDAATIDDALIRRRIPEDFDATFGTSAILQPGEFRVVRGTGANGASYLNNTGDTVYLVSNRTGNLTAVVYSTAYGATPPAQSWANLPDGGEPPNFAWRTATQGVSNCAADATAPAAVNNLTAATGAYAGEVDLQWNAVGNDGLVGTAILHLVKYSTAPITSVNFDAASDAFNEPLPGPPGTLHQMTVFGLVAGQTYHFAIKTLDCQNTSALSTTVPSTPSGTTLLPYVDRTAGLQPYFGNLHSHTSYSDGVSTPAAAYQYARNTAQTPLDFMAVTDHNHAAGGFPMTPALYQQGLTEASAANEDGAFVAIYGQEWGLATDGHVNIFESPVLFGWEAGRFDVFVPQDDYTGLYDAILANPSPWGALASFCHPGSGNFENYAFTGAGGAVMQGIALVNGPAFSTSTTEGDVGNTNFDSFYLTALRQGFWVSPFADQDNHNATWGASSQSRTAVLASALTKEFILGSIASSRTYATQDHNVVVDMQTNGWHMGARFEAQLGNGVDFDASVVDPDGEATALFELFRGEPGVSDAVVIATAANVGRFVHRDEELPAPGEGARRVYFLRITQVDNHRIWTAPVEVTFSTTVDVAVEDAPRWGGQLFAARPNPFNPSTRIQFELRGAGARGVSLCLFDVRGRLVRTLVDAPLGPGFHAVAWTGNDDQGRAAPSGVYVARLRGPGLDARTRLVLVR